MAAAAAAATAGAIDTPAMRDIDLQILLTDAVAGLLDHVRFGKVRPVSLDRRWNVDPRDGVMPIESLIDALTLAPSVAEAIETLKPDHFIYRGLKQALAAQRALAAGSGGTPIAAGPTLKPGVTDPRVVSVRKRLAATGELTAAPVSDDPLYDEALLEAVKRFQEHHRLGPTPGTSTTSTAPSCGPSTPRPRAPRHPPRHRHSRAETGRFSGHFSRQSLRRAGARARFSCADPPSMARWIDA